METAQPPFTSTSRKCPPRNPISSGSAPTRTGVGPWTWRRAERRTASSLLGCGRRSSCTS